MGLLDVIRNAVSIADSVTKDLQPLVLHKAWIGEKGDGTPRYHPEAHQRAAIVEKSTRVFRSTSGEMVHARHRIAFLYPIPPCGEPGRREPVDERDLLVLPSGDSGPILHVEEFIDRVTGRGILTQVWLG